MGHFACDDHQRINESEATRNIEQGQLSADQANEKHKVNKYQLINRMRDAFGIAHHLFYFLFTISVHPLSYNIILHFHLIPLDIINISIIIKYT